MSDLAIETPGEDVIIEWNNEPKTPSSDPKAVFKRRISEMKVAAAGHAYMCDLYNYMDLVITLASIILQVTTAVVPFLDNPSILLLKITAGVTVGLTAAIKGFKIRESCEAHKANYTMATNLAGDMELTKLDTQDYLSAIKMYDGKIDTFKLSEQLIPLWVTRRCAAK